MKHLDNVVSKDPLKLSKYESSTQNSKMIYIFLILIPVCLIFSVLFYFLASMATTSQQRGSNSELHNGDIDAEENDQVSEKEGGAEIYQDTTSLQDGFSKIQIGLKIMPSQNDEAGMIIMDTTTAVNAEMKQLGGKVDDDEAYYGHSDFVDYFPVLRFNEDYVPFGDAASFCINLSWIKIDMKRMYDMYKQVQGFPNCTNSQNPKVRWQSHDPSTGVDFKVWTQERTDVGSEGECTSKGGVFRGKRAKKGQETSEAGKCYTYMVVKRICLMVAFKLHPESASYAWEYRGGCYAGGQIAIYEKAVPGSIYRFTDVPIEVRHDESALVSIGNTGAAVSSALAPVFQFISSFFLLMAFIFSILFAVFFFRAMKASSAGDSMKHKEQIDTD